jgi:hypothetical protein
VRVRSALAINSIGRIHAFDHRAIFGSHASKCEYQQTGSDDYSSDNQKCHAISFRRSVEGCGRACCATQHSPLADPSNLARPILTNLEGADQRQSNDARRTREKEHKERQADETATCQISEYIKYVEQIHGPLPFLSYSSPTALDSTRRCDDLGLSPSACFSSVLEARRDATIAIPKIATMKPSEARIGIL